MCAASTFKSKYPHPLAATSTPLGRRRPELRTVETRRASIPDRQPPNLLSRAPRRDLAGPLYSVDPFVH